MYLKTKSLLVLVVTGFFGLSTSALAEDADVQQINLIEDVGAQERIKFSSKLRMLSQSIAASACHMAEGVEAKTTAAMVDASIKEFDVILTALEHGDTNLNILGAEERRKTLAKIASVKEAWAPLKKPALSFASGNVNEADLNSVLETNGSVLIAADALLTEISGQYANPAEMVQADAMIIKIASRQRMLAQRISKEACMLASHHEQPDTIEKLTQDIGIFEASLEALRHGMPSAGIKAPPTKEISNGLEKVEQLWLEVKPEMNKLISGKEVTLEEETHKFHSMIKVMEEMERVVVMYSNQAKPDA
ncbi:MAG: type IV pili methyl-accepting chemotaxis transducer N-terminal domain-containing protein [Pseudomonadota bacterium]